jgi:RNA polymerase sigma-70 factor, ECF subfamily
MEPTEDRQRSTAVPLSRRSCRQAILTRSANGNYLDETPDSKDNIGWLLKRARTGDGAALGELLIRYRKYLVFLARSQMHHHLQAKADPSDLAQEVCVAAHAGIEDFQGDTAEEFSSWLRGILVNVLAMQIRKYLGTQKRDPRLERTLDHQLVNASGFLNSGIAANITSPSAHFARNEAFLQLAEAIESLPDDYRQVIVLRHVDALPFSEVARIMERSVDSVEKLWIRSLAKLKQLMGEQ